MNLKYYRNQWQKIFGRKDPRALWPWNVFAPVCLVLALTVISSNVAHAAELAANSLIRDSSFYQPLEINVQLNTAGDSINAVEGKLLFPKDLLELSDIKDGDSIMNLWVERPREIATSSATLGEIIFSGITPGGYQGAHGLVFTAVFTPKDEGAGVIDIGGARALLNDGEGTPDSLTISPWSFTISKNLPIMLGPSEEDLTPPEEFKPEISSSTAIFSGRWFLVFTAQDKGSGIAGYAVFESKQLKSVDQISASDWTSAETPYLLKDQSLKSYLYVKAIDKAGNERVETIAPRHPSPAYQYQNLLNWMMIILASAIAVLCLITLGLLIILFWKKIRIKKT